MSISNETAEVAAKAMCIRVYGMAEAWGDYDAEEKDGLTEIARVGLEAALPFLIGDRDAHITYTQQTRDEANKHCAAAEDERDTALTEIERLRDRQNLSYRAMERERDALLAERAKLVEGIAMAIEGSFEDWRTCGGEPITEFPLHSAQWLVKRSYETSATIAREFGLPVPETPNV